MPTLEMHTRVREATWSDRLALADLDRRCFDAPWEDSTWPYWFKDGRVTFIMEFLLKSYQARPIGFASCLVLSDGIAIEKLGVAPVRQRQGHSKHLLKAVRDRAQGQHWPNIVSITVPETHLAPGKHYDISAWIKAVGFKAKPPLQPGFFTINGESVAGVPCLYEELT